MVLAVKKQLNYLNKSIGYLGLGIGLGLELGLLGLASIPRPLFL